MYVAMPRNTCQSHAYTMVLLGQYGIADLQADGDTAIIIAWQIDSQVIVGIGAAQQLETRDDGAGNAGARHTEAVG